MFGIAGLLVVIGVLAAIVSTVFSIWLVAIAFRRHLLWGLASLFLPFAVIVFAIRYWEESKKPFLYSLAMGVVSTFFLVAAAVVGAGAASQHLADGVNEEFAREMAEMRADMEAQSENPPAEPMGRPAGEASGESRSSEPPAAPVPVPVALPPNVLASAGSFVSEGFSYDPTKVNRDGYVQVSLREAPAAVGRLAMVVEKDGQRHRGDLVRADAGGVELQRALGGGTVSYRVAAGRIDSILVDVRN